MDYWIPSNLISSIVWSPVTWSLVTAALCTASWLIGEVMGAARSRRIFAAAQPGLADDTPVGALVVEGWRLAATPSLDAEEHIIESDHKRCRREMFAQMPPLAELRANADAIRRTQSVLEQSVWDDPGLREGRGSADPIAERVLGHYRKSICELRGVNGGANGVSEGTVDLKQSEQGAADGSWDLFNLPPAGKKELLRYANATPSPLEGFYRSIDVAREEKRTGLTITQGNRTKRSG